MSVELLRKKKELLTRVLAMTEAAVFTGDEDDAQVYIDLTDARGELFSQIKILDDKISDTASCTEAEALSDDVKAIARRIYALDEKNAAAAARIMDGFKKSLRDIKDGKNVSQKYTGFLPVSDGMYFDQKN